MSHCSFIHSLTEGHLSFFHVLVIMINAVIKIQVQVLCEHKVSALLRRY